MNQTAASGVNEPPWHQIKEYLTPHARMPAAHQINGQPFEFWEHLREERRLFNEAALSQRLMSLVLGMRQLPEDGSLSKQGREKLIAPMIPYVTKSIRHHCVLPSFSFPLSPDYQLLVLVQYNVLRATLTNLSLMSLLDRLPNECGAAFNMKDLTPPPENIPPSFQPTPIQKRIWHDPWIDIIPWASMRDNLILNARSYDEDDLCNDMAGGLYEGYDDSETRGLIIWGEPWSESGWEASEGFVEKWGFLLKGCDTLLAATNHWREARGEERLILEV